MNATTKNDAATLAAHDCGIIPAGKIFGDLPTKRFHCETCGETHDFEMQGLRDTGIGCGSIKFLTIEEM
jgi:hypothetical protein